MRHTVFRGTAKEIAEQFKKDMCEARGHLKHLEPFSEVTMWISRSLYGIVACYYGESLCHHSNGVSTIQGIKVEKILDDFNDGCLMLEIFACKESGIYPTTNGEYMHMNGGFYPTKNGAYMYKEKNNGT